MKIRIANSESNISYLLKEFVNDLQILCSSLIIIKVLVKGLIDQLLH